MDEWAKAWLRREREKGAKCLEIKYISGKPYVYHSTSRYDSTTKSPRKVSIYLGRLTEEHGLIPKGSRKNKEPETVTWIVEPSEVPAFDAPELEEEYTGDATSLPEELALLVPEIKEAFVDCWREFILLLNLRIEGSLSIAGETGCISGVLPGSMNNDAEETCHTLAEIGRNIGGQQAIFSHLSSGARRIAYPFSFAGSSPGGIRVCAALLFVEVDSGLPVMIRRLPGPGADMIAEAVSELAVPDEEPEEVILFINPEESTQMSCQGTTGGEPDLTPCLERGVPCISLLPHESSRYDTPVYLTEFFTRDERLILTGSAESGGIITYLFKDVRTATQETDELLSALQKNVIDRATLRRQLKRAGRRLIQSSIRTEPEEIYDLAALEDRILTSVTMIRGHFEQDLIDGNAISGSLFISLLSASLLWKMKIKDRQDR